MSSLTIYDVYREALQEDINKAMFVSVQADETTDISNKTQIVIVLHFVKGSKVVEHFHGFVQLNDRSTVGISNCVLQALEPYKLKDKLVSQTYYGASVMQGAQNGVQKLGRDVYSFVHFVHCYARQLNLIMQHVCPNITLI
jgi:hypothetical protein